MTGYVGQIAGVCPRPDGEMADIFLSYAREDRELVRKVASALESNGWTVWWDRNIIAGHAFDEVIERELHGAKCMGNKATR